jgi:hypothetical protein
MSYKIAEKLYEPNDARLKEALAAVYGSPNRPLCMCRHPGVEMYVAKLGHQYIIKRMPHSGALHTPACDSYEPPAELSGLGEVMGGAIQTNLADGVTTLKFDFALSKNGARAAPAPSGAEHDSVKTDGKKLTLRGTLHYLLDEAGLTRWSPAMESKRSWWVVRKYLLEAAADKVAKGGSVADLLYIPESWSMDKKDEIARRRLTVFNQLAQSDGASRRLMLVVGEVKEIGDARFGKKMILKHLSDAHFMMNEDLYKRLVKRFENELSLWGGTESSHLMVIGTFGVSGAGADPGERKLDSLREHRRENAYRRSDQTEATFRQRLALQPAEHGAFGQCRAFRYDGANCDVHHAFRCHGPVREGNDGPDGR